MAEVPRLVAVLGRGVVDDPDAPVLAADDLGLTRGDGCFEVTRIVADDDGVRVDHLDAHLARLARSARALDLPVPDEPAWRELIDAACAAWPHHGEGILRLMLTRGQEVSPEAPVTGILTIGGIAASMVDGRQGIDVITLARGHASDAFIEVPWLLGGVKTLSYALNIAAAREVARRGADDAVFVSTDGFLLEAPRSALVWRIGERLATTPLGGTGVLASITQAAVFAAAAADGVSTAPELITPADLVATDGAWLLSSGRLVAPIRHLDGAGLAVDPDWTARLTAWATGDAC